MVEHVVVLIWCLSAVFVFSTMRSKNDIKNASILSIAFVFDSHEHAILV